MGSASQNPTFAAATAQGPLPPHVVCDLCEAAMPWPAHNRSEILGLLTCSQCIEDKLAARQLENNHAPY